MPRRGRTKLASGVALSCSATTSPAAATLDRAVDQVRCFVHANPRPPSAIPTDRDRLPRDDRPLARQTAFFFLPWLAAVRIQPVIAVRGGVAGI